jgi:hypothetical protein
VFGALDTILDLATYLDAKETAIISLDRLVYAGEEDLLAYYFLNYDQKSQRHFIVPSKSTGGLNVESGKWSAFIQSEVYKRIQERNAPSYL